MDYNNYEYVRMILESEYSEMTIIKYNSQLRKMSDEVGYPSIRRMIADILEDPVYELDRIVKAMKRLNGVRIKSYGYPINAILGEMIHNINYYDEDDDLVETLENAFDEVRLRFR